MNSYPAAQLYRTRSPLHVELVPFTTPGPDQIVVKNKAVSINPVDWMIQGAGTLMYPWIKYPFVIGSDVAGEVFQVGTSVTRFKVGDRVLGLAVGCNKDINSSAEGAFQAYSLIFERLAAPIPDDMSYADAAVLPLGVSTAACALFQKDQLALDYPSENPAPQGKTVLVWGGSTSVGGNAIQLAAAAGYDVITTASPVNFEYVKSLGATQAFDYHSPTVVDDLIDAFRGKELAGAIAIAAGSAGLCADVLRTCTGRKLISMVTGTVSFERLATGRSAARQFPLLLARLVPSTTALLLRCRLRGIRTKFIIGTTLKDNEVAKVIYEDFLPQALKSHTYRAAPESLVVGNGLEKIQAGLDAQMKGVSARKIVITL